jgi:phage portal protein BeeE
MIGRVTRRPATVARRVVLDWPGPATSQADLVSSLMSHLLIWGNGYLAKYRDANGEMSRSACSAPIEYAPS